jgi:hypothetical protein
LRTATKQEISNHYYLKEPVDEAKFLDEIGC